MRAGRTDRLTRSAVSAVSKIWSRYSHHSLSRGQKLRSRFVPHYGRRVVEFERARPDCTLTLNEVPLADSHTPLRTGEIDVLVC
jgi:hypothetical protein